MAKRPGRIADPVPVSKPAEADAATPAPPEVLHATMKTIEAGTMLHRVHLDRYLADEFNPGTQGNARFSPIQDAQSVAIPTLYGGATMDCAMIETIFHDVPHAAGLKTFDKSRLDGQVHSMVEVTEDLTLVDLASVALRKLGVTRRQLIDTEKDQYPATRRWAQKLHEQLPEAQGLSWISRQDDSARAVVLFGDRIPDGALRQEEVSRSLTGDTGAYDAVLDLAGRLDVLIVPGKG
ncbi:RES family NAD+ phosphorylase [Burkholderia perseverans]|uniref:RES family NAD+ phosphorylase n=1 Tax=Burkholderia perseverans TaxID=2615214 RepID=UPI001FED5763|nr:RES family NAD+ phosphorylase [Burkholderia perseverans]